MLTFVNHNAPAEETTTPQTEMTLSDLIGFGDVMQQLTELSLYSKDPQRFIGLDAAMCLCLEGPCCAC